jgi:hypothetical protein
MNKVAEIQPNFFDFTRFLYNLSSSMEGTDFRVELGDVVDHKIQIGRSRSLYANENLLPEGYQTADLFMVDDSEPGSISFTAREKQGRVAFEFGAVLDCLGGGNYESLDVRIKRPIALGNNSAIPRASVKVYRQVTSSYTRESRSDHERIGPLMWKETDLSGVFPNFFLYDPQHGFRNDKDFDAPPFYRMAPWINRFARKMPQNKKS